MGIPYPFYVDQPGTLEAEMYHHPTTAATTATTSCRQQLNTEEGKVVRSFICNECHTPILVCAYNQNFDNQNPNVSDFLFVNVKPEDHLEVLNQQIVVNNMFCCTCNSFVGFRIINFIPVQPKLIEYEVPKIAQDSNSQPSDDVPDIDLIRFKNKLINIENDLTIKSQRLNYLHFLKANEKLIGRYYLALSRVKVCDA